MSFWENVELLREEQNTSYRWIARIMGVSETTVSSMRKSNIEPRASEAIKIAKALGTSVEDLVGNIGETQKESKDIPYFEKYILLKKELKTILDSF